MRIAKPLLLLPLLFSGNLWAGNCITIDTAPTTLTKPGCYKLQQDLHVATPGDNAITVAADNVRIDLAGRRIVGPGDPKGSGNGVYANAVSNLEITNGSIKGFLYGVRIDGGSRGDASANIKARKLIARDNFFRGISIEAGNAEISGNKVVNTGRTTLFADAYAAAIEVKGRHCKVKKNLVDGVFATGIGEGIGISLSHNRKGCVVADNVIGTDRASGATYGIWLSSEHAATTVSRNRIMGFVYPFSIPRHGKKRPEFPRPISVRFQQNSMRDIACTPRSFRSFYDWLPASNRFHESNHKCPALVSTMIENHSRSTTDPRFVFRLAMAKYQCADEPAPANEACCRMKNDSLALFKAAADMGVEEASRILPGVLNVVRLCN